MTTINTNRAGYAPIHDEDPLIARAWEKLARREFEHLMSDRDRPRMERWQALKAMRTSVLDRLARRPDAGLKQFVAQLDQAIAGLGPSPRDPITRGMRALRNLLSGESSSGPEGSRQS